MNILFLSLSCFDDVSVRGIYSDLMRELMRRGHDVYIASPTERRYGRPTHLNESPRCHILRIRTLNIRKTNIIEKGLATLLLERQFDRAIRRYWGDVSFDLLLYSTPPITFNRVIERVKKRCGCRTYLMLKDIFPQNAVDLGMLKAQGLLHRMFRRKERRLYRLSDRIGCMSPANISYVLDHNPEIDHARVELCPNAIQPIDVTPPTPDERRSLLEQLSIPADRTIFIYGGNLGRPQGIDFLIRVLAENETRNDSFIVIVGGGTEYGKLSEWFVGASPRNSRLLATLPKDNYDRLLRIADVGMIFLDRRFTIPNFPSRLLPYLENAMPVLLATDKNTDMGRIAETEGFGLWAESGDLPRFMANMTALTDSAVARAMGAKGKAHLLANYTVDKVADIIL